MDFYEELQKKGLLLILPCKPGDKVYWVTDNEDREFDPDYNLIEELIVASVDYNGHSLQIYFNDAAEKEYLPLPSAAIGRELFLNREAAEKCLSKQGGNEL